MTEQQQTVKSSKAVNIHRWRASASDTFWLIWVISILLVSFYSSLCEVLRNKVAMI